MIQDAHEFLAQCLDQLKEDCKSISPVRVVMLINEVLFIVMFVTGSEVLSCVTEL